MLLTDLFTVFDQGSLVGLSPPLLLQSPDPDTNKECDIIIGYYSERIGTGRVHVGIDDLHQWGGLYSGAHFPIAVHGLKRIRETYKLRNLNLRCDRMWDTRLMAYLLEPGRDDDHRYRLSHLVGEYCDGYHYPAMAPAVIADDYPHFLYRCVEQDAALTYRLVGGLRERMTGRLRWLYRHVELPLSDCLVKMHLDGIAVDHVGAKTELSRAHLERQSLTREITNGRDMDLTDDTVVIELLHAEGVRFRNHAPIYRSRRIKDSDLEVAAASYPLARKILRWRHLARDIRFLEQAGAQGRIHPIWRQTRHVNGRLVAQAPPVQNISKQYRSLLKADQGLVLIKADYAQCQMRCLAHLSNDPALVNLFQSDGDIHQAVSESLRLGDRRYAKPINFGLSFGMGAASLRRHVNERWGELGRTDKIDGKTAKKYITEFFFAYPGISKYYEDLWQEMLRTGDTTVKSPITGRIRRFRGEPDSEMLRQVKACQPQMMESDIAKQAMLTVRWNLHRHFVPRTRILLMIHDAIWLETEPNQAGGSVQSLRSGGWFIDVFDFVQGLVKITMEKAILLRIPLKVDFDE